MKLSNPPAAGNAGFTHRLRTGHHLPGVPEPDRSAAAMWGVARTGSISRCVDLGGGG
jgi:hypothetical protein